MTSNVLSCVGGSKEKSKFRPSAVRCPTMPSAVRLPSDRQTDRPTDHKKLILTLPLSDVRRLTWGQSYTDFYKVSDMNTLVDSL